jgi:hypothetical protein
MTNKTLMWVAALALATFSVANAKTYDIVLSAPTKVGNTQLTAGEYKMKVEGANAIFTDQKTFKSVTVPAKVESSSKKFESTQIDAEKQGDMDHIKAIELGGSTTKLEFGQ